MDLKQLEYFVRVAEMGSFTRASTSLDVAQPALSRQIRGYAMHDAVLTGVETRTSSPIRIQRGEGISAADYIDILNARRSFIARTEQRIAPYDALVLPTTANTPPSPRTAW